MIGIGLEGNIKYPYRDQKGRRMSADFEDADASDGHIFADQDAAVIYQALMQIIAAIDDLKHVIVDLRESIEIVPGSDSA